MRTIAIDNLYKYYGKFPVLKGVSLTIKEGEVFGFIGPNGAGKTTLLESIMGLKKFNKGSIKIFGYDVEKDHKKLVNMIGAQLQEAELSRYIKIREAVQLQGALFKVKPNVSELLKQFDLFEKSNIYYSSLSGGQKQKLFILLAQIHEPEVLIFDELSTGLDPVARSSMWYEILKLKSAEKTVLISTHSMEEAAYVCDRLALIKGGNILAVGTPKQLVDTLPFRYVAIMSKEDLDFSNMENKFYQVSMSETQKVIAYIIDDNQKRELVSIKKDGQNIEVSVRSANLDDYYQYKINKEKI